MSTKPNDDNAIPPEPHAKLLAELERFEHLLFEPMTQADLDQLNTLSERWTVMVKITPLAKASRGIHQGIVMPPIGKKRRRICEVACTIQG
ncbi:hypothetical protein CKO42_08870 [Lamprobacter modestohalophilus]|uniref:Uncharacterized protein n=1 Tax=Lamprobacter modestohalophilus TaxID=1064514 RepID=A0A9X0W7S0_9GAMM|nr:hypothetical protein [Lamprobacter modestohalophilus]MBK1618548.1 hypothetical protein [Lamprobacter modestohalophilus]